MLNGKTILITGGTGSFGHHFVDYVLQHYKPAKIIIYSRDEYKQFVMNNRYKEYNDVLRFFIGDVRDDSRLRRAMNGVDYVIHAAALKQVPACEYNPNEAIKTNINGAMNVIESALDSGVNKVVALSTDKAVNPINLYGGTKLVSDKLFCSANAYSGENGTIFAVVRYGNVAGSRGSVIPFFQSLIDRGERVLPITDLAEAMLPGAEKKEVGIREGEKLHEVMVTREDSFHTYEYDKHYIVYPHYDWWSRKGIVPGGKEVEHGFEYSSGTNIDWLSVDELRERLKTDIDKH